MASAGSNEPGPSLTGLAEQKLFAAAGSDSARNGRGGTGSVAIVVTADGQQRQVLPLTPRRANCEVEHGLKRDQLIEDNIDRVRQAVASMRATRAGLDLLAGIADAVRGAPPGVLIIISNGLSTAGGFDIRQVRWDAPSVALVAQLHQRQLLTGLLPGWTVLFTGLGDTAGPAQQPLTKPVRDTVVRYWSAICTAAAAGGTCQVDQTPLAARPPASTAGMPVIDIPGISSAIGPDGRITTTLAGAVLFAAESVVLTPDAREVLRGVAGQIADKHGNDTDQSPITIRGYVADPPASTPESRQQTADQRAAAVAEFLRAELAASGISLAIDAAGMGTPPGRTAIVDGMFDETTARGLRMVTVTY